MSGMGEKRRGTIPRARRRVQTRRALLLTLGVCLTVNLARIFSARMALPAPGQMALDGVVAVLVFGGAAYLGLCVPGGDPGNRVRMRALSEQHTLCLCLLGVLAVCPATLLADMIGSFAKSGAPRGAAGMAVGHSARLFLPQLLKSALLAPVFEELFFRGYLTGALERLGRVRAALVSSLCFAIVHMDGADGFGAAFAVYALLGGLLCAEMHKTGSLLAPMLVHGCYNLTLVILSYAGLSALFEGLTLLSCLVRLLGCLAFYAVFLRVYAARASRAPAQPLAGLHFTGREKLLLLFSLLAMCAAVLLGGMKP